MNYRTVTIHAEENLGTSGTKVIPIRLKDPITSLIFLFRTTFSTGARLIPEPDVFSKIEIVDGSDVLMALSGTEMAALNFYEGNKYINTLGSNIQSDTFEGCVRVQFGRFLRDPMLAFDPTKFLNPQLKVTFNTALVQALATPVYLRVVAECFDEKVISPIGFLRMTEFHSYVGDATTFEYIDLPTDLDIRKLYLQTKNFGASAAQNLTSIKLSEDNDKRVPFDVLVRDWIDMQLKEFGVLEQYICLIDSGTSYPAFVAPCAEESGVVVNGSRQEVMQMVAMTGGKFAYAGATGTSYLFGKAGGNLPYYVHCYPFGDQQDVDDWYKLASRVGSLKLRIYSGASGASVTYNTILQQLRRY